MKKPKGKPKPKASAAKPKSPPVKRAGAKKPARAPAKPKAAPSKPPRRPPVKPVPDAVGGDGYEAYKEQQAAISRERSKSGREIGPLPPVADPARRERCRASLRLFCETYLPDTFQWAWSPDHLTAIGMLEECIFHGGQFAFAMPRGSGKSSLSEAGVVFAALYGHRRFIVLIGSTAGAAADSMGTIKAYLETNDAIAADFPEVAHPVRELEGANQRANMQTVGGVRTRMKWKDSLIVLPTVAGSLSSGTRIVTTGVGGQIRGRKATTAGGASLRPDLALVDDPQTDESAVSPLQNDKLEKIINRAVLGMAGPKTKIAVFMPCTIIAPGDAADRLLDRDRNPVWQGQRSRMLLTWPTNRAKWDRYFELRKESQRAGGNGEPANELYQSDRAAMDLGAAASWVERYYEDDGEVSAVQHAMNIVCDRGERAFNAEFQNDPQPELKVGQLPELDPDAIAQRVNRVRRGVVPVECTRLTAFIDCGKGVLWYVVAGWTESFAGAVVDYGVWPKQNRSYFSKADARPALADIFTEARLSDEALLFAGLKATVGEVLSRPYARADGAQLPIGLCMVDSGYLDKTVAQFCRQSAHRAQLTYSKGYGVTAAKTPMDGWLKKSEAERKGDSWRQRPDRSVLYDTNWWKSFVANRLTSPEGGAGALYLFGEPADHQMFADHLTAESRTLTSGQGRTLEEWRIRPGRDNDWLDCLVGSAVAASVLGVKWDSAVAAGEAPRPRVERKKLKLSDLYAAKHGGRR